MRTRRLALAVMAVTLAAGVAGCSPESTVNPDPVIWYNWTPGQPAMRALLTTKLQLNNGCLTGSEGVLLAFPASLGSWDPDTYTLTYGGDTFHVGDTINAGGGNGEFPSDVIFPPGCDVNNNSTGFLIQATSLK
jgi:hypothetical protein